MSLETQAAIVAWYIDQMAALREQVDTAQQQAFTAPGGYSDEAVAAYVATIVPVMAGAQAAAAQLTAAYLAYMVADMTGQAVGAAIPAVVDLAKVTGAGARNGVAPETVYRRPFEQVWREVARLDELAGPAPADSSETGSTHGAISSNDGSSRSQDQQSVGDRGMFTSRTGRLDPIVAEDRQQRRESVPASKEQRREVAMASGERRARTTGLTDLQLATTNTAQEVLSKAESVVGYRRVLTGAENCGMCVVAATRLYHKRDLMPIHPNCDCVIAPVMSGEDPGRTINNRTVGADIVPTAFSKNGVPIFDADQTIDLGDLLQETHDAVTRQFGKSFADAKRIDYRKVITVRQHGETGPTLTVARHKFTKRQIEKNNLRAR
jgi:hypothetical protein